MGISLLLMKLDHPERVKCVVTSGGNLWDQDMMGFLIFGIKIFRYETYYG